MGVCHEFELNGRCPAANCKFEHVDVRQSIREDVEPAVKGNLWPLTCYGPFLGRPCLPGFVEDRSFEEERLRCYEAKRSNFVEVFQQLQQFNKEKKEAVAKLESLLLLTPNMMRDALGIYNAPEGVTACGRYKSLFEPPASADAFASCRQPTAKLMEKNKNIFDKSPKNLAKPLQTQLQPKFEFFPFPSTFFKQTNAQPTSSTFVFQPAGKRDAVTATAAAATQTQSAEGLATELRETLQRSEARVVQKIDEIALELSNIKAAIRTDERLAAVEAKFSEVETLKSEVAVLRKKIDKCENKAIFTDVIITGIPLSSGEEDYNCTSVFLKLCEALQLENPPARRTAYRELKQSRGENNSPPIIIKLFTAYERDRLIRSVAGFCKTNKRSLTLADVGCAGQGDVSVQACLSKANREIMHYAVELKRQKLLSSVFTIRGQVAVRVERNGEVKRVSDKKSIDDLILSV